MPNLVLIGPPGSGKGTQAVRLAELYRVPHISTGDILRGAVRAGSALGVQVEATLASGGLVGDEVMTALVRARLGEGDVARGFVLDGFPRTVVQARALDETLGAAPLIIALIVADDAAIVQRLSRRRLCESCRLTQSVSTDDEDQAADCPYCGGALVRRHDDQPETVVNRLRTYAAFAEPVINYYRDRPTFGSVDGLQDPDFVTMTLSAHVSANATRE